MQALHVHVPVRVNAAQILHIKPLILQLTVVSLLPPAKK